MMAFRRTVAVWSIAAISAVIGGCGEVKPPPPPPPTIANATFLATPDVNPNDQGQASPIVVHVFELSGTGKFAAADYFSLLESPDSTLGPELLGRQELQLVPGGEGKFSKRITNGAANLGIIAGYRDISQVTWRTAIPLPPNQTTAVTVAVSRQGLILQ